MDKQDDKSNFENVHWADNSAQNVINVFPNEEIYTVASGITPSGTVHIGNFREVITSEFVRKALESKGKKTKFIYSWDSYDAFRKVPKNVPREWEKYLRLPDAMVPSPFGEGTYGDYFMREFEDSIKVFNFPIEFQRQHELQTSGIYAKEIRDALNNLDNIRKFLDNYRKELLKKDWFPLSVYSEKTGKDTTKILSYDGEYLIEYECLETGFKNKINFRETPIVKLSWKLDWPMRWNHYKVSFEPGGKDHSTPGSSYTVGSEIIKDTWGREPPVYTAYNFVRMKGQGGKISSSSGNGVNVSDVLKVYTPEMVLFLFAGTRSNAEFDISFDLDVIKIYEDFDKLERLYYELEEEKNLKKLATKRRIYELSMVNGREIQERIPFQPSFRHLSTISQANDFDFDKIKEYYGSEIRTDFDEDRLKERFECVKNWLEIYAPEGIKFSFQKEINVVLDDNQKEFVKRVREFLRKTETEQELVEEFKLIVSENNLEMKDFFQLMYKIIIGKEKGPKLSVFLFENKGKVLKILDLVD